MDPLTEPLSLRIREKTKTSSHRTCRTKADQSLRCNTCRVVRDGQIKQTKCMDERKFKYNSDQQRLKVNNMSQNVVTKRSSVFLKNPTNKIDTHVMPLKMHDPRRIYTCE